MIGKRPRKELGSCLPLEKIKQNVVIWDKQHRASGGIALALTGPR